MVWLTWKLSPSLISNLVSNLTSAQNYMDRAIGPVQKVKLIDNFLDKIWQFWPLWPMLYFGKPRSYSSDRFVRFRSSFNKNWQVYWWCSQLKPNSSAFVPFHLQYNCTTVRWKFQPDGTIAPFFLIQSIISSIGSTQRTIIDCQWQFSIGVQ